jgi:RNA recognition motif-containing protein
MICEWAEALRPHYHSVSKAYLSIELPCGMLSKYRARLFDFRSSSRLARLVQNPTTEINQMTNIFVGNLSYQTTEQELEAAFTTYGAVERASIVRDRETGQPRGFAFIEMTNKSEAIKAIQGLDGQDMNGRAIKVNEARPKEDRGSGGGGGFGRRREPRW